MDAAAILQAIRDVIEGAVGSVRTVAAGTLQAGGTLSRSDEAAFLDSLVKTRYDVQLAAPMRTGALGPSTANLAILEILPTVILTHVTETELEESQRYAVRARAITDSRAVTLALTWPGNLTQTAAAAPTGLVSGLLVEFDRPRVLREDWNARIYQTQLSFRGYVLDVQPIS